MSRKVFTAGEVLAAADVNSFLMDQTVMSFPTAAARGSAIASPTVGMYTHLEDSSPSPRLQFWNGSAWRSPHGMTLIATSTFTNQSSVNITGCFSAEFDNYRIVSNIQVHTAALSSLRGRLLSGTTPQTANYTASQQNWQYGTNAFQNAQIESAWFAMGWIAPVGGTGTGSSFDLTSPFLTRNTTINGFYTGDANGAYNAFGFCVGQHNIGNSYDGIQFLGTSGNITGSVRIYGYRNA